MNRSALRDQRGVAMVLELLLVAVVLSIVGLAVYQAASHTGTPLLGKAATPSTAEGIAATAAATAEKESSADSTISAAADASADAVSQSDQDLSNLGDTANASF